jgi:hypothetical protein
MPEFENPSRKFLVRRVQLEPVESEEGVEDDRRGALLPSMNC